MSTWMMWTMICFQTAMLIVSLVEGKTGLAIYWIGAAVLTLGLIIMNRS